jgi:hypothetical protein
VPPFNEFMCTPVIVGLKSVSEKGDRHLEDSDKSLSENGDRHLEDSEPVPFFG